MVHRLTAEEYGSFFILLVAAGNETTRNAISHGMYALATHPDQRALLMADFEARIPAAVEEIVRWATPVIHFRRTATEDCLIGGQDIAAGDKVVMWFNSANRDEAAFEHPYRFDIARTPNEHVGFGAGGPHFCLGANLARREITVMFRELFRHLPDIEVTGDPDVVTVVRRRRCGARGCRWWNAMIVAARPTRRGGWTARRCGSTPGSPPWPSGWRPTPATRSRRPGRVVGHSREVGGLPATAEAFAAGEVSVAAAREIVAAVGGRSVCRGGAVGGGAERGSPAVGRLRAARGAPGGAVGGGRSGQPRPVAGPALRPHPHRHRRARDAERRVRPQGLGAVRIGCGATPTLEFTQALPRGRRDGIDADAADALLARLTHGRHRHTEPFHRPTATTPTADATPTPRPDRHRRESSPTRHDAALRAEPRDRRSPR